MKRTALLLMTALLMLTACQESKRERFEREAREFTQKNCPCGVGRPYHPRQCGMS